MRHWIFGCAMTLGASTMADAAAAATMPPAVAMNLRRAVLLFSSSRDELVVRALGDVVPWRQQCLELRERRVHLPGHRTLLGLVLDDLGRKLLELAQHRRRILHDLDLALEFRPEALQCDGVLHVE